MALPQYKIGVNILAVNGVSAVLRTIGRDVLGLGRQVDVIGMRFGRWRVAALGVGAAIAGIGIAAARAEYSLAKMGDRIVRQQALLKAAGVSAAGIGRATSAAERVAITTPGATTSGGLSLINELRAGLGSTNAAIAALPGVTRSVLALRMSNLPGFSDAGATRDLIKALDLFGAGMKGGKFDPATFARSFKELTQVEFATGGLPPPNMLLRIAQLGGFTGQGLDFQRFLEENLSTFLQLGSRAGSGIAQLGMQLYGGNASIKTAMGLQQYGLVAPGGISHEAGHYAIKPGALYGYGDLIQNGIAYWLTNDLLPKLRSEGITAAPQIIAALSQLFGSVRAARAAMTLETPAGAAMAAREAVIAQQAFKSEPYAAQLDTLKGSMEAFSESFRGMLEVLGLPLVKPAISFLHNLTNVVLEVEGWAVVNPQQVREVAKVITGITGALVALGAAAVLGALVSLAGPGGLILALSGAIIGLGVAFDKLDAQKIAILAGIGAGAAVGGAVGGLPGAVIGGAIGGLGTALGLRGGGVPSIPGPVADLVKTNAQLYGLSLPAMNKLVGQENGSFIDSNGMVMSRVSPAGAIGPLQLMPSTAKALGIDPFNWRQNVAGGMLYFSRLLTQFGGDYGKAAAAYVSGAGTVWDEIRRGGANWLSYAPAKVQSYASQVAAAAAGTSGLAGAGVPPLLGSRDQTDAPMPVWIVNGKDIAQGTTSHLAKGLQTNPNVSASHNTSQVFSPPGRSQLPVLLP